MPRPFSEIKTGKVLIQQEHSTEDMLPLLFAVVGLSTVTALEQGNAQKAADSLTSVLAVPGEFSDSILS